MTVIFMQMCHEKKNSTKMLSCICFSIKVPHLVLERKYRNLSFAAKIQHNYGLNQRKMD